MKILCISANTSRLIVPPFPLGLASVVAALGRRHEVRVVDCMFTPLCRDAINRVWQDFQPDLMAVSMRNLDNQDSCQPVFYFPEVREFIEWLRDQSRSPIILGGSAFNIVPLELAEYLSPDFGLMGEGELAFRALVDTYPNLEPAGVPGLLWRDGDEWRLNPPQAVADLDALPDPAWEHFSPGIYHEAQGSAKLPGMVTVQSRRGCPMRCIYCTTPRLEGRRLRARSPAKVAALMADGYERWGLRRYYFVDNIFNYPRDYARELCRAIQALNLPLDWSCLINPAFPDADLFRLIREAGGNRVQVGNESGSDLILTRLGKGFSRRHVEQTFAGLVAAGLDFGCFLLLGGPGETPATVRESVTFLEQYQPFLVNLTVGLRIYPGTPLHGVALAEGVVKPSDNLLWPHFYLSPAVADWIWDYLQEVRGRHPNWIF
jgi:radical SAM superfamily enzyme YgiQ (UPF0313 family)